MGISPKMAKIVKMGGMMLLTLLIIFLAIAIKVPGTKELVKIKEKTSTFCIWAEYDKRWMCWERDINRGDPI